MKDKLELDPRILEKNLEITKLTQQVDNLTSAITEMKHYLDIKIDNNDVLKANDELNKQLDEYAKEIVRLTVELDDITSRKVSKREQTPMHMLQTLEKCYELLEFAPFDNLETAQFHRKDLRNVIKFLEK